MMTWADIETKLKKILGSCYGGPSLSFANGEFIIYSWFDAPVFEKKLGAGDTIEAALKDYDERVQKERALLKPRKGC